jgi:sucrose-phosphate synthase
MPTDVADLYRLAAKQHGVFVNPALTEPFGLTLLEAAASGLPVVATNDGGPMDIIANCQNGLLIDPLDNDAIEKALLRVLMEPKHWEEWSANGIRGAHEFYTWKMHADRYLRDVVDIVKHAEKPAAMDRAKSRQLPEFDRLIITDLDNTLTGDDRIIGGIPRHCEERGPCRLWNFHRPHSGQRSESDGKHESAAPRCAVH